MKYSEYFGAKRRLSFKNENIRYDASTVLKTVRWSMHVMDGAAYLAGDVSYSQKVFMKRTTRLNFIKLFGAIYSMPIVIRIMAKKVFFLFWSKCLFYKTFTIS